MNQTEVKGLFSKPQRVVITTHKSPDGDAIGSSLALKGVLEAAGHQAVVVLPDAAPSFLMWMNGADQLLDAELNSEAAHLAIQQANIVFCLDYNNLERIGPLGAILKVSSVSKLLIDHHLDPSPDFDFLLSDTAASSTAELVYRFVEMMGWQPFINGSIAECLYAGIITDTGSFKFSSTSAQTHRIAAALMDSGLQAQKVHQEIYDTSTFDRLKLVGYALSSKLEFNADKAIAIIPLSLSEKNRFKYQKGDTEGLVNYGLSIQGSKMAVFLSEEMTMTKFSFRSKGDIDVNSLARQYFNGGGHKNAAGGKLDMGLKDALIYLRDVIENKL